MTTIGYLPSVVEAQNLYVQWQLREHWLRKDLQKVRSSIWKMDVVPEYTRTLETNLSWCRAEAEHRMVYYRSVLHAQGVQAI